MQKPGEAAFEISPPKLEAHRPNPHEEHYDEEQHYHEHKIEHGVAADFDGLPEKNKQDSPY